MIDTILKQLDNDILNFFNSYNIKLSSRYTPEIPGLSRYMREFFIRDLDIDPARYYDNSKYQNRLLYRFDTPKLSDKLRNRNLSVYLNNADNTLDTSNITFDPNASSLGVLTWNRVEGSTGSSQVITRDISLLDVPVEFMIVTENKDLIFDICLLFYQKLSVLNTLDISIALNPNNPSDNIALNYFMNWDLESLNINYANPESDNNYLNTLEFNMILSGAFFSNFYKEDGLINTVELTMENT